MGGKRALVIGSGGGIGAALVDRLVASGQFNRIYAGNRRPHSWHHPNVTTLTIDILDDTTLAEWTACIQSARTRLLAQDDVVTQLLGFVAEKR